MTVVRKLLLLATQNHIILCIRDPTSFMRISDNKIRISVYIEAQVRFHLQLPMFWSCVKLHNAQKGRSMIGPKCFEWATASPKAQKNWGLGPGWLNHTPWPSVDPLLKLMKVSIKRGQLVSMFYSADTEKSKKTIIFIRKTYCRLDHCATQTKWSRDPSLGRVPDFGNHWCMI
jgi:hypothetical protein